MMGKAVKKVKAKLGEKEPSPKTKPKRLANDYYPDTAYMWQALAGKELFGNYRKLVIVD